MQWLWEKRNLKLLFFFFVSINSGQLFRDRKEEMYESEVLSDQYHLLLYIYIWLSAKRCAWKQDKGGRK